MLFENKKLANSQGTPQLVKTKKKFSRIFTIALSIKKKGDANT